MLYRSPDEGKEDNSSTRIIHYPNSIARQRYRIDVLLPLYLDEMVREDKVLFRGRFPDKALAPVNFYEGVQLAVDTLATMGYNTDVYVHDVTTAGKGVGDLLKNKVLDSSDLLIGYVTGKQIQELADFANRQHINFISAFSPSDATIKDNPYFFLVNPTLQANCNAIVDAAMKKRNKEPLIILKRMNVAIDSSAYSYVQAEDKLSNYSELDCTHLPDSATLAKVLEHHAGSIVLIPIMDAGYVDKLISRLDTYFPNHRFSIYGMPSWKSIITNKKTIEYGDNISIYMSQPFYFDPTVSMGQAIADKYKETYGGTASEMTFRGFELMYWMTDLLNKYGTIFNEKTQDNGMAIFTRYDFVPKWDDKDQLYYMENKHLYIYRYQSGTVLVQ